MAENIAAMKNYYQKMHLPNPEIKEQYNWWYQKNPELHKRKLKVSYQKFQEKKKRMNKNRIEKFLQQVKQGPY